MKNTSKKTGVSTNGHIENINQVDSVKCNCKNCFHSNKAAGTIYCNYYDLFSPKKTKCARYSPKENHAPNSKKKFNMSTYTPTFPWETP